MRVRFHKQFDKQFQKLRPAEKQRAIERIKIFSLQPYYPHLNNHALKGNYIGYRSINITGDLRAVYKLLDKDTAFFVDIDTHSNLYR